MKIAIGCDHGGFAAGGYGQVSLRRLQRRLHDQEGEVDGDGEGCGSRGRQGCAAVRCRLRGLGQGRGRVGASRPEARRREKGADRHRRDPRRGAASLRQPAPHMGLREATKCKLTMQHLSCGQ